VRPHNIEIIQEARDFWLNYNEKTSSDHSSGFVVEQCGP
tara:strand:- start:872 stop:988 length:117 start_codon:yes stop_codon:yes gene_type:complete